MEQKARGAKTAVQILDTASYVKQHILRVQEKLQVIIQILEKRSKNHDRSKLEEPEFSLWKEMDSEPKYEFNSLEYFEKQKKFRKVFELHYKNNRHHPEYHQNGVNDMNLVDLLEFLIDSISYKEDIRISEALRICEEQAARFQISEQLTQVLKNTVIRYFALMGGKDFDSDALPTGVEEELKTRKSSENLFRANHVPASSTHIVDIYV